MKKTICVGILAFLISGVALAEEKIQLGENFLGDRDSLVARLMRHARGLDRDISRSYLPHEVKRSAERFKNASRRLYSCENDYPSDRYGRDRVSFGFCEREFSGVRSTFRNVTRTLDRGGYGSYEIEERIQTLQRIIRRLARDYDNGGGRDPYPYPNEQYVCTAEAEEGWNTRPVRGSRAFSLRDAKLNALRACERVYNYCFVKSCQRI
ncbi:MAG: hypothetical protein CME68_07765 [Halobacteriovoraceae bacterium]|nr:hypothetical protein [Halobacteriovoraceae bacterium]